MIAFLIAAQLASADLIEMPLTAAVEDAYRRCVVGSAVLLEGSNDRPADVADAADFVCRAKRFEAMKAISSQERRERLQQSAKIAAAAMVTISRACTRAKECAILNVETAEQAKKR